jgi:hypothetical protein
LSSGSWGISLQLATHIKFNASADMNVSKDNIRQALKEIAERNDVSLSAVEHLLQR